MPVFRDKNGHFIVMIYRNSKKHLFSERIVFNTYILRSENNSISFLLVN